MADKSRHSSLGCFSVTEGGTAIADIPICCESRYTRFSSMYCL